MVPKHGYGYGHGYRDQGYNSTLLEMEIKDTDMGSAVLIFSLKYF